MAEHKSTSAPTNGQTRLAFDPAETRRALIDPEQAIELRGLPLGRYFMRGQDRDVLLKAAEELRRLADGMKVEGFIPKYPIILFEGNIFDGLNQSIVAGQAGVKWSGGECRFG
jgi:hypothetical protein